jgi:hypothetical protein
MTWQKALDLAIARTGHGRLRALCSQAHPDHAAYRLWVLRMAGETEPDFPPSPIPLTESLALLRIVNACPYRSRDSKCGCSGHRCALRRDHPIVTHLNCLDCAKCYGSA